MQDFIIISYFTPEYVEVAHAFYREFRTEE